MGLLLSDLSRSFASALDLNLQPWDFNLPRFPRVVWPQDWRLPHLRGLEFMDQRAGWGREGVGVRRRRVGEREAGGGREFVDDELEEERRARGGRGGIAKNWGWNKTKERDLPPPPPRERRLLQGEDPLNDLARYVRKARVDLAGFSWAPSILARSSTGSALGRVRSRRTSGHGEEVEEETDEEASRRRKRDEAFEVLNFSRIQPVRLKVVKRMRSGLLGREIGAYLTSQLPSTPIDPPSSGHPLVFSLSSEKFFTVEWHEPSSDLDQAITYVQQTMLATALSVLCVVRPEEGEEEGRARAEELGFYQAISKSSPLPPSAAKTLVLLDKANSRVRLLLLEVQTPRERVFDEFAKEELNFELTAKDQIFHREFPPHPSIAEANALQAHIFASCLENRVMNFVLTDVETWVFGNVDPATGVMHVSPVLDTSSRNPTIFECFMSLVLRSFDARPRFDVQHRPIPLPTRISRRPSLKEQSSPSSSSRQPSLSSHTRSHSTPYPPSSSQHSRSHHTTSAPSRPQSRHERDLPPLPPSSSQRTRPPTPILTRPQPQRPSPRSPHPRQYDDPESYAERARPPYPPTRLATSSVRAGPAPPPSRRVGPEEDSSDDQDRFEDDHHPRRSSQQTAPLLQPPSQRRRRTRTLQEEDDDDWDDEELAWERGREKRYGSHHSRPQPSTRKPTRDFAQSRRWEDEDWDSSEQEETEVRGGRGEGLRREGGWEEEERERMRGKGYGRERDTGGSGWSGGGWGGSRVRYDGRGREGRGGRGGTFSLRGDGME
ncbi:hypothetical protein BDY24DRAFT_274428 [Mrakia frigida]|uniref:uncharacterized protein n=1 Tax=Mrakia frigida TaxID=29902 RepID=UPI003FCC0F81